MSEIQAESLAVMVGIEVEMSLRTTITSTKVANMKQYDVSNPRVILQMLAIEGISSPNTTISHCKTMNLALEDTEDPTGPNTRLISGIDFFGSDNCYVEDHQSSSFSSTVNSWLPSSKRCIKKALGCISYGNTIRHYYAISSTRYS